MSIDHLGDANKKAGATPEESSAVETKGDAMSDGMIAAAETDYAVRVGDRDGLVMQVSRRGIWVPPDIPTDECARRVLDALSPMIRYIIEHEVAMRMGVSTISPANEGGRDE